MTSRGLLADVMLSTISFSLLLIFLVLFSFLVSVIYGFISSIFFLPWLLAGMATLLFFWARISAGSMGYTSLSSLAFWLWGHFILRGLFLSQHGICVNIHPRQPSITVWISDGSYLGLDIIGTSRRDGQDGNRAAFCCCLVLYN